MNNNARLIYAFPFAMVLWSYSAPHKWAQWPIIISVIIIADLFLRNSKSLKVIPCQIHGLVIIQMVMVIGLVNWSIEGQQYKIGHSLGISLALWCYLALVTAIGRGGAAKSFLDGCNAALLFFSISVIADFVTYNYWSIELFTAKAYPEGVDVGRGGKVLGFHRSRGLAPEPGYAGWAINSMAFMSLALSASLRRRHALLAIIIAACALIMTFSATSMAAAIAGIGVAGVVTLARHVRAPHLKVSEESYKNVLIAFAGIVIIWLLFPGKTVSLMEYMYSKASFEGASGHDRMERYSILFNDESKLSLMGYGFGYHSKTHGTGLVSFYITTLVEGGVIFFLFILWVIYAPFFSALQYLRYSPKVATIVMSSTVASSIHLCFVTGFDAAWSWALLGVNWAVVERMKSQRNARRDHIEMQTNARLVRLDLNAKNQRATGANIEN